MTVLMKILFRGTMMLIEKMAKYFTARVIILKFCLTKFPCFKILMLFQCKIVFKNSFCEKCRSSLYHSIYTLFLLIY